MSQPPYQQQPPYGQPPYGQPPYGQPPYGPGGAPYGSRGGGGSSLRVLWIVLGIVGGVVVLCIASCGILGYLGYRTVTKEQPLIQASLDGFMKAMSAKDAEKASAMFSSRASTGVDQLKQMLEGPHAVLFQKYQSLSINEFRIRAGTQTAVPGFSGLTAEIGGSIQYQDGSRRAYQAVLIKEGKQWKLYSINITLASGSAASPAAPERAAPPEDDRFAASAADRAQFRTVLLGFAQALGRKDHAAARGFLARESKSELDDSFRLNLLTSRGRLKSFQQIRDIEIQKSQVGSLTRRETGQKWPLAKVRAVMHYQDGGSLAFSAVMVQEQGLWRVYQFDIGSRKDVSPQRFAAAGRSAQNGSPAAEQSPGLPQPPAASAPEIEHLRHRVHVALHRFLSQAAGDPEQAARSLSTRPPARLNLQELRRLRESRFREFTHLQIFAFSHSKGYSRRLPGFRGTSAYVRGEIYFKDGTSRGLEAVLVKQDQKWHVYQLVVP